ncbi:MAG: hypothetical protein MZW92_71580 [Comamonadaceae bacterium]|nr:hypothetical protein [Comamonadaceae bacterium]
MFHPAALLMIGMALADAFYGLLHAQAGRREPAHLARLQRAGGHRRDVARAAVRPRAPGCRRRARARCSCCWGCSRASATGS